MVRRRMEANPGNNERHNQQHWSTNRIRDNHLISISLLLLRTIKLAKIKQLQMVHNNYNTTPNPTNSLFMEKHKSLHTASQTTSPIIHLWNLPTRINTIRTRICPHSAKLNHPNGPLPSLRKEYKEIYRKKKNVFSSQICNVILNHYSFEVLLSHGDVSIIKG
jgi:hypothetical protein